MGINIIKYHSIPLLYIEHIRAENCWEFLSQIDEILKRLQKWWRDCFSIAEQHYDSAMF